MCFFPPKPTDLPDYDMSRRPHTLPNPPPITVEQIRGVIAKLQPYKATDPDGMSNAVLKYAGEEFIFHLLYIFQAIMASGVYPDLWKDFWTIVLRKPGWERYDLAKSFRPIAILKMLPKLFTSVLAEDISYLAEKHQMLPRTQFGGRPGHAATDAVHMIVQKVQNAWRNGQVVSILSLDVEAAFPSAVIERLLFNMRRRGVPEAYVHVASLILHNRRTQLKFDGFLSDWMDIDNGFGAGDPISMIFYDFYNADFFDIPSSRHEMAVGFVDDKTVIVESKSLESNVAMLIDFMEWQGSGFSWFKRHRATAEISKTNVLHCSRRRIPDPRRPRKTIPEPRPPLVLQGEVVKCKTATRILGVMIDEELKWDVEREFAISKATSWVLQFCQLSCCSSGVPLRYMRQLYLTVAVPKMTYGLEVWYTPPW